MKIWDCKYYEVLDFYQGGIVVECSKKNVQISNEEDICKDCEYKEKRELKEGEFDCLDLENGVAYHDCSECDEECESRNYFENEKKTIKYHYKIKEHGSCYTLKKIVFNKEYPPSIATIWFNKFNSEMLSKSEALKIIQGIKKHLEEDKNESIK